MTPRFLLPVCLLACDGDDAASEDSTPVSVGGCLRGPSVTITSPESSAVLPVGQAVSLTADASSEVDSTSELRVLWAVAPQNGETDNVGTGLTQSWTPTEVGIYRIFIQVEDSCTDSTDFDLEPVQDDIPVEVE